MPVPSLRTRLAAPLWGIAAPTPPAPVDFLTAWQPEVLSVAAVATLAAGYGVLWLARGRRSGYGRLLMWLGLGVAPFAYAVCGPLQVYGAQLYWVAAAQVAVLAYVVPVGLALGDPMGLVSEPKDPSRGRPPWLVRALTTPAVSSVLGVVSVLLVFLTPYLQASVTSPAVEVVLVVQLVATGLLFVLPLLTQELLPAWASPGIRLTVAFADGLLDAVPGVVVMTSTVLLAPHFPGFQPGGGGLVDPFFDQRLAGGVLLVVSEAVGLPVIAAVFVQWVRADAREARDTDRELDALAPGAGSTTDGGLWWESDSRFQGRFRPDRD